jgi:hypothetical protein
MVAGALSGRGLASREQTKRKSVSTLIFQPFTLPFSCPVPWKRVFLENQILLQATRKLSSF